MPSVYDEGFPMDYLYSVLEEIWTAAGVPAEQVSLMYGGFQGGPQLGPPDAERRESLGQQILERWAKWVK